MKTDQENTKDNFTKEDRLKILEIYSRVYIDWDSTLADLEEYVKSGKTKTHDRV